MKLWSKAKAASQDLHYVREDVKRWHFASANTHTALRKTQMKSIPAGVKVTSMDHLYCGRFISDSFVSFSRKTNIRPAAKAPVGDIQISARKVQRCTLPVHKDEEVNGRSCLPKRNRLSLGLQLSLVLGTLACVNPAFADLPDATARDKAAAVALTLLTPVKFKSPTFSFDCPSNWETNPPQNKSQKPAKSLDPPFIFKAGTLNGAVNVGVTKEKVPDGMDVEGFAKATLEAIEAVFRANSLKFGLVSKKQISIAGTPAYEIVLLNQMQNVSAKQIMLVGISEGQGICITCTTAEDWFPQFETLFHKMIESTKFGTN